MNRNGIHHLTLTVTDVARSTAWYTALLGEAHAIALDAPGWRRTGLVWPDGLFLVLTQYDNTSADDRFDHARVGLDHVGIGCPTEQDIRAWAAHMDATGVDHGPVEDASFAWVVTAHDPDGIAVEFFCSKH